MLILVGTVGGYLSVFNRTHSGSGLVLTGYSAFKNFRGAIALTLMRYSAVRSSFMPRGRVSTFTKTYYQMDFTLSYGLKLPLGVFSIGGHYIFGDDASSRGTYVVLGGYGRYLEKHALEIGGAFSSYPMFKVVQGVLSVSERMGSKTWINLNALYINIPTNSSSLDFPMDMYSVGGGVSLYPHPYDAYVGTWIGKRMFTVWNYGFVVYNFAHLYSWEIYSGFGYTSGSIRYGLDLTVGRFEDITTGSEAYHTVLTFSVLKEGI